MDISNKKFEKIQKKAENEYRQISSAYCPYFKKDVAFNAKRLEHIKFKARNKARSKKDQYVRLRCLPLAKQIIELTRTVQGYQQRYEPVAVKRGKWSHERKSVEYHEFVALIKDVRVRVIVKKVEGGVLHFWSIIPFWRMDTLGKRLLHNGNPRED